MEKALKEQQKPLTSAQMFAMQANINLEHEQRLENVEKRLDAIEQERGENGKLLLSVSMSSEMLPEISLRNKVRQLVNKYASATNTKTYGTRCMNSFIIYTRYQYTVTRK